ncbi:MAG: DUF177 domain-containing protein [Anaerolineales bacterium]|nr:DUF177 domain-containing protein [Anaerolineales bacterium]
MSDPHSPLRLNVGFIVAQTAGFSRDFPLSIPQIKLPPDVSLTGLVGTIRITRTPQGLLLQCAITANIATDCVRCLTPFSQPLHTNFTELYAFSKRHVTDSGLILPDDYQIDLTPLVREYLLLEVPIRPLCRPDCKGLCPVCGNNLNESECNHDEEAGDERLSALKDLLEP